MSGLPEPLAGLVREHRKAEATVLNARHAIEAATARTADDSLVATAIQTLRDLDVFLAADLMVHIAKEEEVLFPAMRRITAEASTVVDDMLAQHDAIRLEEDELQHAIATLDATHDHIQAEAANLHAGLATASTSPSMGLRVRLRDAVTHLDWILQGHFGDEEDALFEPAPGWFTEAQFAAFAEQMRQVEQDWE